MIKQTFSEAIKVKNGIFYNLQYHKERANRTAKYFFGQDIVFNLSEDMIPLNMKTGTVKCRVVYTHEILSLEFSPYSYREIKNACIIHDNNIDYSYKRTDRSEINKHLKQSSAFDEILIVKDGCVTDASASNLVFENETGLYTPSTYLLPGTKRKYLLENNIISERIIKEEDIKLYSKVYFINAMVDLEDQICLNTESIARF